MPNPGPAGNPVAPVPLLDGPVVGNFRAAEPFTYPGVTPRRNQPREESMAIERTGSATWQGGLKDGKGNISTESGALEGRPYGFATRFEGERGTNPEELLGAAHAGCFTMALSLILGENGLTAERMDTTARVSLDKVGDGFEITAIHLTLRGKVPGTDQARFEELATQAKVGCPVSKLFKTDITLDARLES